MKKKHGGKNEGKEKKRKKHTHRTRARRGLDGLPMWDVLQKRHPYFSRIVSSLLCIRSALLFLARGGGGLRAKQYNTMQYNAIHPMVLQRKAFYDTYGVRTYNMSFVLGTHMRKKKPIYRMIKKVRREHQ